MKKILIRLSIAIVYGIMLVPTLLVGCYSIIHFLLTRNDIFIPFIEWSEAILIRPLRTQFLLASRRKRTLKEAAHVVWAKQFSRAVGDPQVDPKSVISLCEIERMFEMHEKIRST